MANEIGSSRLLDTWGSSGNRVEPGLSKKEQGWLEGERPAHEYMNWIQSEFGQKLNHLLKNGVPKWNAVTEYDPGSIVNYGGELWKAAAPNVNSAPSAANSDWKAASFEPKIEGGPSDQYVILPNGKIFQWGSGSGTSAVFPITFPNAVDIVIIGDRSGTPTPHAWNVAPTTTSVVQVYNEDVSDQTWTYFAVGS